MHHATDHVDRDRAVAVAEATCARRGAQLTPLRRRVLEMVLEADAPVGAYALLDRLRAERPGAGPPTVYRALDFLLDQRLIHKVERLNAFLPCIEAGHAHDHDHAHQFLICRGCGRTTELSDPGVAAAVAAAADAAGFHPAAATVEVEGTCATCAAA